MKKFRGVGVFQKISGGEGSAIQYNTNPMISPPCQYNVTLSNLDQSNLSLSISTYMPTLKLIQTTTTTHPTAPYRHTTRHTKQTYAIAYGPATIKLAAREYMLLDLLIDARGKDQAVTIDDIAFSCYDWQTMRDNPPDDYSLRALVRRTRSKLQDATGKNHIAIIKIRHELYKVGYKFYPRGKK